MADLKEKKQIVKKQVVKTISIDKKFYDNDVVVTETSEKTGDTIKKLPKIVKKNKLNKTKNSDMKFVKHEKTKHYFYDDSSELIEVKVFNVKSTNGKTEKELVENFFEKISPIKK